MAEQRRDDEGEAQVELVWRPDAEDHSVGRFVAFSLDEIINGSWQLVDARVVCQKRQT